MVFAIFDSSRRGNVETNFETRKEAEERLAELIAGDPSVEGIYMIQEPFEPENPEA